MKSGPRKYKCIVPGFCDPAAPVMVELKLGVCTAAQLLMLLEQGQKPAFQTHLCHRMSLFS